MKSDMVGVYVMCLDFGNGTTSDPFAVFSTLTQAKKYAKSKAVTTMRGKPILRALVIDEPDIIPLVNVTL